MLANYLTILLRPSFEEPVDTIDDLIKRDITPIYTSGGEIMRQFFAASLDPKYQEISRRLIFAKDRNDYKDMIRKVNSTGKYARIGKFPYFLAPNGMSSEDEMKYWYRSSETIGGTNPFTVHPKNKKWPLKKVF